MKIKITRHSERLDLTNPIKWLFSSHHYWSDSPITVRGQEIAKHHGSKLAKMDFNPTKIFVSPYVRTHQTADEILTSFPEAEIISEPQLSEYQKYLKHNTAYYPNGITGLNVPETLDNFNARVVDIINKYILEENEDILIVAHAETIRAMAKYFIDRYDIKLDHHNVPYLATLHFELNSDKKMIEESILITY